MTLAEEIKGVCHAFGIRINTDLGQHFLIDEQTLADIVKAGNIKKGEQVVEIGAGIGVLTRELIRKDAKVMAIELDDTLIAPLHQFATVDGNKENLTVIASNALQTPMPDTPYKIVANIPYHITSPLLRHVFLESVQRPTALTLLIQREVAEKICDTESAGMLTILVGLFGTPSIVRNVAPDAFLPPPQVESAVLHIESFAEPKAKADIIEKVFTLTKIAFSQKRKKLRNTLGADDAGNTLLTKAGIDEDRRPQTLSVDEWITLASLA